MKIKNLQGYYGVLLLLTCSIAFYSCSKDDNNQVPEPVGAYSEGFFILNEGWFQHESGSVSFYGYGQDTLMTNIYAKENGGAAPTTASATLENGLIFQNRLYLISKAGGPITIADAATLKALGTITLAGSDFRSLVPLDDTKAVVSSSDGIYAVDLKALTIDAKPVLAKGAVKSMLKAGNYLFASANSGVDIIDPSSWKITKHYDGPTEGYVKTPDGNIYGAGENMLVRIDPASLDTVQIPLVAPVWKNDYAFNVASVTSSAKENAVFYVAGPDFAATKIYRYTKDNAASLASPFITLPAGEQFYQTGLGYDKKHDWIVTFSITGYNETDKNFLRFYDAKTGSLEKTIEYGHPYFPASLVFQP